MSLRIVTPAAHGINGPLRFDSLSVTGRGRKVVKGEQKGAYYDNHNIAGQERALFLGDVTLIIRSSGWVTIRESRYGQDNTYTFRPDARATVTVGNRAFVVTVGDLVFLP